MGGAFYLPSLIAYVVSKLADMEASFAKTKLVKLLYLVDVESYRRRSRKLSGLEWVFFHYGPYAFEIDSALKQLDLDLPQEGVTTRSGRRAIVFRPTQELSEEFVQHLSVADKRLVDRILAEWGIEELNPLLTYVYFHTEPMKDAKRGDVLDFSKIQPAPAGEPARPKAVPSSRQLEALRARLEEVKNRRTRQVAQFLDPKPRFDEAFWRFLARLNQEERYTIPKGTVELDGESKRLLREEGDERR